MINIFSSFRVYSSVLALILLSGCQGYRDFVTTGANAFHPIAIEVAPDVKKIAKIEGLNIFRKPHEVAFFVVTGDITFGKSCKVLSLDVSFVNTQGVALHNTQAAIMSYVANSTARFSANAYITAYIGETKDIIDKVVIKKLTCL